MLHCTAAVPAQARGVPRGATKRPNYHKHRNHQCRTPACLFLFPSFYYVNWRLVAQVFAVCRENSIEATQGDDVDEDDLEAPSNAIKLSYDITYYLFLL